MMIRRLFLAALFAAPAFTASRPLPPLAAVGPQTVYLFSMGNGFDQYLANQFVKQGLCTVTTDPKKATAVLTDSLGGNFEDQFDKLYAPPPPPPKDDKDKSNTGFKGDTSWIKPVSTFSRGRGNLFLVDVKSKQVLWSTYLRPKRTNSHEMDRAASQVAHRWRAETSPKQQQ